MNSEHIKNKDPLQLQQMVIFLKAELTKYKHEVRKIQDSNHYSLVVKLEQENSQLMNDKDGLYKELQQVKKEFEKRTGEDEERIHLLEMQRDIQLSSIDALQNKEADLWMMNKQLTKAIELMKDEFASHHQANRKHDNQISSLHRKLADYKMTIEQLEYKLANSMQETNKQFLSEIKKLASNIKVRSLSETEHRQVLKELAVKNEKIGILQQELSDKIMEIEQQRNTIEMLEKKLNEQNDRIKRSEPAPTIDSESLLHLDTQINELLTQSLVYEEKLNAKFLILNDLECKLDQLTGDIMNRQGSSTKDS